MSETRKLTVLCPECGCEMVLDAASGEVLLHKAPKRPAAGGRDFDALLKDLDEDKARAESVFEREKEAMKDRDRLLSAKFEEALRRAKESGDDDEPPPRPFDLD